MILRLSAVFMIGLLAFQSSVLAQGVPTIDALELSPSTFSPAPGQTITITAKSYSVDLNSSTLTWTSGGRTLERGIGVTSAKITAPAMGKSVVVNVTAVTADGTSVSDSLAITSGTIDIIIESDGYTPPLFRGKLPPVYQNSVKIIAIPHLANSSGVEHDPKSLLYRWEQNGNHLEAQSGYGRQSIVIPGSAIPRPFVISVTVSTRDGSLQSSSYAAVNPGTPALVFYRNDPLYGPLYNSAIGDTLYLGEQRETGVLAVPFGFNAPADGLGDLGLNWSINGRVRPELALNRSVTLRAPEGTAGSSDIDLRISNTKSILQGATASFRAIFSANAANNSAVFNQ